MFTNAPTQPNSDSTFASDIFSWANFLLSVKAGLLAATLGVGYHLRRRYINHQVLKAQNKALKAKLEKNNDLIKQYETLEAVGERQSSTLYLMHREVIALNNEQKRQFPNSKYLIDKGYTLDNENDFEENSFDLENDPQEALDKAQQRSLNMDNFINETGKDLLYHQWEQPCASNSIKKFR